MDTRQPSSEQHRSLENATPKGEGKPTLMMLPYVAGVSERACRNYNIKVVFRSGPTFRSMLTKCQTDESAIAEHAWAEDHPINWSGTKILQRASHTMELVMKEALCIQSTPADSRFNRDGGYELPDCRSPRAGRMRSTT